MIRKCHKKLKGEFYKVMIRPTMLYGEEANQSVSHSEDESCGNKDVVMDV